MQKLGAFPDTRLRDLESNIRSVSTHARPEVGPASIDVPTGNEFYRLPGAMHPVHGENVRDLITRFGIRHSEHSPLEVGITYAVPLGEIKLPADVYGYYNPKSSVGRVDVHCRVIVDKVARYDTARPEGIHGGYEGFAWLLITPNSFVVMPPANIPLVQLRLFNGDTRIKQQQKLVQEWRKTPLAWSTSGEPYALSDFKMSDSDGTVLFTADLEGDDGVVGYRAKVTRGILHLGETYSHDVSDFFEPVRARNGEVLLAPGVFYLLRTNEVLCVPSHLAAELIAMDVRLFEGRSHYAGFIDPGFKDRVTLEVRCAGMLLRRKQPVARMQFERLTEPVQVDYRERPGHYNKGNTLLSKHFKRS